jgi:hypothetical protein
MATLRFARPDSRITGSERHLRLVLKGATRKDRCQTGLRAPPFDFRMSRRITEALEAPKTLHEEDRTRYNANKCAAAANCGARSLAVPVDGWPRPHPPSWRRCISHVRHSYGRDDRREGGAMGLVQRTRPPSPCVRRSNRPSKFDTSYRHQPVIQPSLYTARGTPRCRLCYCEWP